MPPVLAKSPWYFRNTSGSASSVFISILIVVDRIAGKFCRIASMLVLPQIPQLDEMVPKRCNEFSFSCRPAARSTTTVFSLFAEFFANRSRFLSCGTNLVDVSMKAVEICHLYISPGHNFVGHHGREPDTHPAVEMPTIECVAGHGIRGDRYFDFKDDYKGQITFFSGEVFDQLCFVFCFMYFSPSAVRRNVITRGVNLNDLIGQDFKAQGVRFHGMEECRPCYWMDRAIAPGAEQFLKGRGGLRARILSNGELRSTVRIPQTAR